MKLWNKHKTQKITTLELCFVPYFDRCRNGVCLLYKQLAVQVEQTVRWKPLKCR